MKIACFARPRVKNAKDIQCICEGNEENQKISTFEKLETENLYGTFAKIKIKMLIY